MYEINAAVSLCSVILGVVKLGVARWVWPFCTISVCHIIILYHVICYVDTDETLTPFLKCIIAFQEQSKLPEYTKLLSMTAVHPVHYLVKTVTGQEATPTGHSQVALQCSCLDTRQLASLNPQILDEFQRKSTPNDFSKILHTA